ncbi:hypothetical protein EDB81DRAFT_911070 [Dactylonectria macrodidyma]|uniref:BZIP domain-containing protein n=1 Tax=Dactylonectria macrodidyma TaxID=307937 RepID=A0A9P9IP29_9HYPO|nr:hypothetical protein EDB81DRAFT_911070 [Dactylonectria macrodidyma]
MRQAAKMKAGDVKKRRERNRQSQHEFRQRRQAAEEAQRRRIQQLETTIEEMSNVFIGFCDEMIGMEETAGQPKLMARLQHSTAQVLLLARSVYSMDEESTTREEVHKRNDGQLRDEHQISQLDQRMADSSPFQVSSRPRPLFADNTFVESADADATSVSEVETWDLGNVQSRRDRNTIAPLIEQVWPQPHQHEMDANFFSLRLVEVTLSQACLYLNGDLHIPEADLERAFGFSLRFRSREQLLADLRWRLGPGKNELHQATGINWDTTYDRRPMSNLGLFWPASEYGNNEVSGTSTAPEHSSDKDLQPEFLTALGVQEQLESLDAKVLSPDTMELSIRRQRLSETNTTNSDFTLGATQPALTADTMGSTALRVQLSVSLLAINLSYVAMCLDKGPVYPRREVARAVGASVILASEG